MIIVFAYKKKSKSWAREVPYLLETKALHAKENILLPIFRNAGIFSMKTNFADEHGRRR